MTRISVVIPVFNCERFVGQALDSVLCQTLPIDEIIVVNDGSTDATLAVLAGFKPRIHVIDLPHMGPAIALNRGLEVATGDMLTFLDADDVWTDGKTEIQLNCLEADPALDAVFGGVQQFMANDVIPVAEIRARAKPPQPGVGKIAMMIRRSSFERVGIFNPELTTTDFVEWYARARSIPLRIKMMEEVVAFRRLHDANTGRRSRDLQAKENLDALRRMLASRRAQQ
jgi:glycosyltransferase involved in cell wall biosynthesis